jgi:hypothetical protein
VALRACNFGTNLQRDKAMQGYVLGFVNHTHSVAADLLDDAIVRNGLANHEVA